MKTTGQILKENRERKGITLNEVALATKINVKILTAIEEGETDRLPTKTFLRGFVRSYTRYLGLDEEAILSSFYEEMGSTKPQLNVSDPDAPDSAHGERPAGGGVAARAIDPSATGAGVKIGAVAGILALVALIVVFKKKMDSYQNEAVIPDIPTEIQTVNRDNGSPLAPIPDLIPSPTPDPALAAVSAPTPSPSPSPSSTAAPPSSPGPSPTVAPSPSPSPTPVAAPSPPPTATPMASPAATPSPSPSPSPPLTGRVQEVIIEALDNVDVEAVIDGEAPRKLRLATDQVHTFKAKRKVILKFSDGGTVNLIVNGNDRGVPGDLGKPARVELP